MDRDPQIVQMREALVQNAARDLRIPVDKAREFIKNHERKRWEMKERIYGFIKSCTAKIESPTDRQRLRIKSIAASSGISEARAEASVVVGDIEFHNWRKVARLRNPSIEQVVQTYLGTSAPIPNDILEFYKKEQENCKALFSDEEKDKKVRQNVRSLLSDGK
jgi:hypothetical protein